MISNGFVFINYFLKFRKILGFELTFEVKDSFVLLSCADCQRYWLESDRGYLIYFKSEDIYEVSNLYYYKIDFGHVRGKFRLMTKIFGYSVPLTTFFSLKSSSGKPSVLFGRDGWLYLDNDTNLSRLQAIGSLQLKRITEKGWQRYFNNISLYLSQSNVLWCYLIAPSKELACSDFYPEKIGDNYYLNRLLEKFSKYPLIYPDVKSVDGGAACFYHKTDTHWNFFGAKEAFFSVINEFSLPVNGVDLEFSGENCYEAEFLGDLAAKVSPVVAETVAILKYPYLKKYLIYDNKFNNTARVIVTANFQPVQRKKILVLGSSSSMSMLKFYARYFQVVVFLHSASSLDREMVKILEPEFVVFQSNARFMVSVPKLNFDFSQNFSKKIDPLKTFKNVDAISQLGLEDFVSYLEGQ